MAAGVVAIKTNAALTLDAPVHFMIDKWSQVLITKRALAETVSPGAVTSHNRHILKVALTTLVAHRAIMRMTQHQTLNDSGPKNGSFRILNGNPGSIYRWCHAGHHDLAGRILLVLELLDGALAARADRTE